MSTIFGLGELLSLGCAVTWAIGVIFMRKSTEELSPLVLNVFKIFLATLLFIPTIIYMNEPWSALYQWHDVLILAISGIIGIGIADTLWLSALSKTNASTVAILDCSYSPSVVGLSFVFLSEVLTWLQFFGGLMVISALFVVAIVGSSRKQPGVTNHTGIVHGTLAVILMAVGVVIMKPILDHYPLMLAIEVRLVAGLAFLLVQTALTRNGLSQLKSIFDVKAKAGLVIGSFFAAYLSMILWVGGTKYTDASIAAVINQTSTFFIVFFAWLFLKEHISKTKVIACVIGFIGCIFIGLDQAYIDGLQQAFFAKVYTAP